MKEQGLGLECFVPLFNAYLLGTFTLNWWPLENLLCLMLSIHLFYLRTFFDVKLMDYRYVQWVYHLAVLAFLVVMAQNDKPARAEELIASGHWAQVVHYAALALPFEILADSFRG